MTLMFQTFHYIHNVARILVIGAGGLGKWAFFVDVAIVPSISYFEMPFYLL